MSCLPWTRALPDGAWSCVCMLVFSMLCARVLSSAQFAGLEISDIPALPPLWVTSLLLSCYCVMPVVSSDCQQINLSSLYEWSEQKAYLLEQQPSASAPLFSHCERDVLVAGFLICPLFPTADLSQVWPEANQHFSKEIDDEANSYFQRIYNHPPHPTMSVDEVSYGVAIWALPLSPYPCCSLFSYDHAEFEGKQVLCNIAFCLVAVWRKLL